MTKNKNTLSRKDKQLLAYVQAALFPKRVGGVPYIIDSKGIKRRLYQSKPDKATVKSLSCQGRYN